MGRVWNWNGVWDAIGDGQERTGRDWMGYYIGLDWTGLDWAGFDLS